MQPVKLVYNENIIASGPSFFLAIPSATSIQVIFRPHGSSLTTAATFLRGLAITGDDEQFVWTDAQLINSQPVNVSHPDVPFPKYIRYGWTDNPSSLDLYNTEGLPASPFLTDELPTPRE